MKVDPRIKLLIIVLLTTLAVLAKDVAYLAIVALVALIVNILLKTDIVSAFKRIKAFLGLLVFITVVQSLTIKGGMALIRVNDVNLLTTVGLRYATEFFLRMTIIVLAGVIATSADGREMTDGLVKMHMPYELAFMTGIALKNIPLFKQEFQDRLSAIAMRGIDVKKLSFIKKINVYSYLISPTISGAIVKSAELSKSIESKGFRAVKKRTMLRELKLTPFDWFVFVLSLLLSAGFLACMYIFGGLVSF